MTIDHLIAYCERRKAQCEARSRRLLVSGDLEEVACYDGKSLVYDEMIDKLKLIKEFGK